MSFFKWFVLPALLAVGGLYLYTALFPQPMPEIPQTGWFGSGKARADDTKINPFTVSVPDEVIEDLKSRLSKSRVSHEFLEDANSFEYGFNSKYLQTVKDYWLNKFDWKKQEKILNSWPQFTTEIEGVKVHYYHVKPDGNKYKKVLPLLIVHGWPGNVFEFYKILPMLVDPAAHKVGGNGFAFEVIAPSIPGYGFSEQPKKTGFSQVAAARVFKKLMERVGHKKFYLQGGDWGSLVTANLARMYPENSLALHLNMVATLPSTPKTLLFTLLGSFFPEHMFSHKHHHTYNYFTNMKNLIVESGYMHIQATKPDTVGTALNDSPIGLAAYILEKFSTWTNMNNRQLPDGGLTKKFTMDELLTVVTIYWTQGNIVSSQRFYKEYFRDPLNFELQKHYLTVPTAHAQFANEFFDKDPPEIVSVQYNLTSHTVLPDGGHFAALEEPLFLARDLFSFVSALRK